MSAGGLLEIPAFMVGLSGVITMVEKGLRIWQIIASTKYFGEDLVKTMCKLHFEYALFQAWCEGVGVLPNKTGAAKLARPKPMRERSRTYSFAEELEDESRSPFYIAVTQIVDILEKVQEVSTKIRILQRKADRGVGKGLVETATPGILAIALGSAAVPISLGGQKRSLERSLSKISFFRRTKFQIAISETSSEKEQLDDLIEEFAKWNRKIWDFLPAQMKDAVIREYLPATVFDNKYDRQSVGILLDASKERFPAISNEAHLWIEKEEIELIPDNDDPQNSSTEPAICIPMMRLHLSKDRVGSWQLATFEEDPMVNADGSTTKSSRRILVEWYQHQGLNEEQTQVSTGRISKLARITRLEQKPADLRILTSHGYVKTSISNTLSLGLLFDIPSSADPLKAPASLESLFKKDKYRRCPTEFSLRQKFVLANQLATSLASFHRVHWYHKNFNTKSVMFFYSKTEDHKLLVDSPYICGFGFSRPDDPKGLSLNPDWEMHVHPELQDDTNPDRPKFQRRHDIYSLGVLLFDIGTWGGAKLYLDKKGGGMVSPEEFRTRLEHYSIDLRGRMGEVYKEVTLWCLRQGTPAKELNVEQIPDNADSDEEPETKVDDENDDKIEQIPLQTFYWKVLHELGSCHCSAV